jgi:putative transposase
LKQPRRSSPRLQTFDYTGPYAYSITINANDGLSHFNENRFVRFCIKALHEKATMHAFEVLAYCFMPNHVHLLVEGLTESSRLKPFIQQFKQLTGYAFKQEQGLGLWHRSYYDHVLRKEEDLQAVAAYIWSNPVRADLVENAEEYPYSGPAERLLGEAGRLGEEAALGGQSVSSVRTGTDSLARQA